MAFNNNTSPKGQDANEPDPSKVIPDVAVDWMLLADSDIPISQAPLQSSTNRQDLYAQKNKNESADDNLDWLKSLELSPPVQTYSSSKKNVVSQEDTTTSFDDIDWLIVSDLKTKIDDSKITRKVDNSDAVTVSQGSMQPSIYTNEQANEDLNLDGLDFLSLSNFNDFDSLDSLNFDDVEEFDINQLQDNIDDTEIKIRELSQLLEHEPDDALGNDNDLDNNLDTDLDITSAENEIVGEADNAFADFTDVDLEDGANKTDLSQDLAEMPSDEDIGDNLEQFNVDFLLNANDAFNEDDYDEVIWSSESPVVESQEFNDSVDNVFAHEWNPSDNYPVDDAMWDLSLKIDSSKDLDLSHPLESQYLETQASDDSTLEGLLSEASVSDLGNDLDWENIAIANTDSFSGDLIANDMIPNDMDWDYANPAFLEADLEPTAKSKMIETPTDLEDDNQNDMNIGANILDTPISDLDISEWNEITSSKASDSSEINQDLESFLVDNFDLDNFDLDQFDDNSLIEENLLKFPDSRITTGLNNIPLQDNPLESKNVDLAEPDALNDFIQSTSDLTDHSANRDVSEPLLNDSYEVDIDDEILVNELLGDNGFIPPLAPNSHQNIATSLDKDQKLSNEIDDAEIDFSIAIDSPTSTSSFHLDMGSDFLDEFELDDPKAHFDDFSSGFMPSSLSTSLNPSPHLNTPNASIQADFDVFDTQENSGSLQQGAEIPEPNPLPLPFLPPLPPKREPIKQGLPQPKTGSVANPVAKPPAIAKNAPPMPPNARPIPMDIPPHARKPVEAAIPQKSPTVTNVPRLRDSIPDLNSIGLEEHDDSNDWSELLDSTNLSDSITTIISSGHLGRPPELPKRKNNKDNIDAPVRPPLPPAVKQGNAQLPIVSKVSNSSNNDHLAQVEFERIAASDYYSDDSQVEAKPTTVEKIKKFKTSVLPPLSLETIWQDYLKIPVIGLGVIGIVATIFGLASEPIFNMGLRWGVFKNASGRNFSNADFSGANLENVDFSKANLAGARMEKANLVGANLQDAKLDGVNFTDANLSRTRLINASVVRSEFKNAQMNLADLSGANLERSNLTTAKMDGANLMGTKIGTQGKETATKFSPTVLLAWQIVNQPREGRNLSKQNLSGLNLNSANLRRANLSGARLNYTDMTRADLSGANLSSSQVNGVNWNGAKLTGANVSGIVFDANKAPRTDNKTICPDRKNGPCKF